RSGRRPVLRTDAPRRQRRDAQPRRRRLHRLDATPPRRREGAPPDQRGGDRAAARPALAGGADDRDEAALAGRPRGDLAVAPREDRVVTAEAHARARAKPGAALAHDDHPGLHVLAGEDLDAEPLRVRVAPVAGGSETFLVRHYSSPSFEAGSFAFGLVERL